MLASAQLSASSLTSLCLCGECDDSGECSSTTNGLLNQWVSGGAKPSSLTIKWIGSGPAPDKIDAKLHKNKDTPTTVYKNPLDDTYFIKKDSSCKGCNNLFVCDSTDESEIASLHTSCSNTLYVGQKFGRGSGAGNDNTCGGTGGEPCIFEVVGACVLNGNIEQCTGDQTGNPEGPDWEFVCSAPTLEPAPSPFPTESNLLTPEPTPEPTVSEACKLSYYLCHTVPFANLSLR